MERAATGSLLLAHLALTRAMRTPSQLLTIIALPLLFLWGAVQFLGALPDQLARFPTHDYLAYIAPGLCVAGPLPGVVLCGAGIYADRRSGMLDMVLAAPLSRAAVLLGTLLTGVLATLLSCIVVLLAALLDNLPVGAGLVALPALLCLAALVSIPYCAAAFALAAVVRRPKALISLCLLLVSGGLLVSDLFLPASLLPGWLIALAQLNPLTQALGGARAIVWSPVSWPTFRHDALVLTLIALCASCLVLLLLPRPGEAR